MAEKGYIDTIIDYFRDNPVETVETLAADRADEEFSKPPRDDSAVNYGIQRFKADQKRVFYPPEDSFERYLRAKTDTSFQPLFDPELKDKIDDYYVLPDDPLVKPPPLSPTYRSGVEFGDVELGYDLLNQMDFNPVLLAGLRDDRSISDFVKYVKPTPMGTFAKGFIPGGEGYNILGNAMGLYNPGNNQIFMNALSTDYMLPDQNTTVLAHELIHKGAELLRRDSDVDLNFLKDDLEKQSTRIRNESKEIKAEHRYLQSLVNTAYMNKRLEEASLYGNNEIKKMRDFNNLQVFKNDPYYKEEDFKAMRDNIVRHQSMELLSEANRSFQLYFTPDMKRKFGSAFVQIMPPPEDGEVFYNMKDGFTYDNTQLKKLGLDGAKTIYNLANSLMAEEKLASRFKEQIEKGVVGRDTSLYGQFYFPKQVYSSKYNLDELDEIIRFNKIKAD